jgi:hypothetical protein
MIHHFIFHFDRLRDYWSKNQSVGVQAMDYLDFRSLNIGKVWKMDVA